jgi:hypothetical protein
MTQTVSRDKDNNIIVENGQIQIIDGIDSVRQRVSNAILMNKGDNLIDVNEGIYFVGRQITKQMFLADEQEIIMSVPDVERIYGIDIKKDGNVLNFDIDVETKYGRLTV